MIKKENLNTKIFIDSGDPAETKEALGVLGFLDGQTTNPTLFARNPLVKERLDAGEKFSEREVLDNYKNVVGEISELIPSGSVSIEVHAEKETLAEDMLSQAREMNSWISNAHIKLPITGAGLEAASVLVKEGVRINMTLCFSQEQAAAVHAATRGSSKGQVYVSPFIGRLDDLGKDGLKLVENVLKMYRQVDSHVDVLAASVRNLDHLHRSIEIGSDIVTLPFDLIKKWADGDSHIDTDGVDKNTSDLDDIPYQEIELSKNFIDYDIKHELTDAGLIRFAEDWNNLIKKD